jgi:hypothetical protein
MTRVARLRVSRKLAAIPAGGRLDRATVTRRVKRRRRMMIV